MYKTIIEFKENVAPEVLEILKSDVALAFQNRLGTIVGKEADNKIIYEIESKNDLFLCLHTANINLYKNKKFVECVKTFEYVDTKNKFECADLLETYSKSNSFIFDVF